MAEEILTDIVKDVLEADEGTDVLSGELIMPDGEVVTVDEDVVTAEELAEELREVITTFAEMGDVQVLTLVKGLLEDDWTGEGVYEALEDALTKARESRFEQLDG